MVGLWVPPMGGRAWSGPWSGDAVFAHDEDAHDRIVAHLESHHAVSVTKDSVGRWVITTAEKKNVDRLVMGQKTLRKTDTTDTVLMDAYEASPGMAFAEFIGIAS